MFVELETRQNDGLTVSLEWERETGIAALEAVEQPVWVVDASGLIRFANGAAVAALGYSDAGQLVGRDSHETIHHHPDGRPFPTAECRMLRPRTTGETVTSDLFLLCVWVVYGIFVLGEDRPARVT